MKSKKEKGITLIALVVTIVVLIILATVSVNAVLGQNGIIGKAKQAKEVYEQGRANEEAAMQELLNEMAKDTTPIKAGQIVEKPSNWTSQNVTPISDGNGGTVPLPSGFYYVGGDISTGLVISDKSSDTMNSSGVNMGNQFVWIPVANEANFTRTLWDENGKEIDGIYTMEPYPNGYEEEESQYNIMRSQVLTYGGFYIGRFEAGVNSTTLRTESTQNQIVVCKKGVAPYNYVAFGKATNDVDTAFSPTDPNKELDTLSTTGNELPIQNGCAYLARNMYSSSNSVTSTLVYGCQWDAMCRYIENRQEKVPVQSKLELTGSTPKDVFKNIYDLAGNCWEWSMEAYGEGEGASRVLRGGHYGTASYPIIVRGSGALPYYIRRFDRL